MKPKEQKLINTDNWSKTLYSLMIGVLAPAGYRFDKIYGEVAIRTVLTKDTVDETYMKSLAYILGFKRAIVEFANRELQNALDLTNYNRTLLGKTKWYQFKRKRELRAELTKIKYCRDTWAAFLQWTTTHGPKFESIGYEPKEKVYERERV